MILSKVVVLVEDLLLLVFFGGGNKESTSVYFLPTPYGYQLQKSRKQYRGCPEPRPNHFLPLILAEEYVRKCNHGFAMLHLVWS